MEERALAAEVGKWLKRFRDLHELRQDDIARAARHVGLPWTRSVVVALEAGRRYLTIDELVRLPLLGSHLGAPLEAVHLEANGSFVQLEPMLSKVLKIETMVPVPAEPVARLAAYRAAGGDLEQKVARRFRLDPFLVAQIAFSAWGRSLTDERDRRITEQRPLGTPQRALQALRGHVTRALLRELAPRLVKARHRRRPKKGGPR